VKHHDIEDTEMEMLTRRQIGLDYQSHYAYEDMTTEVAVPSPDPSQLWDRTRNNQLWMVPNTAVDWIYMIKHRGRNKQVRERVCDDPGLMGRQSHLV